MKSCRHRFSYYSLGQSRAISRIRGTAVVPSKAEGPSTSSDVQTVKGSTSSTHEEKDDPSASAGIDDDNCTALMQDMAPLCCKAHEEQLRLHLTLYLRLNLLTHAVLKLSLEMVIRLKRAATS